MERIRSWWGGGFSELPIHGKRNHYIQNLEMHTRQMYSFALTAREPEA